MRNNKIPGLNVGNENSAGASNSSQPSTAPELPAPTHEHRSSTEPFKQWLFTKRNPFIKGLAAVAIIMLMIAAIATGKDKLDTMRRNSAWSQMMIASRQGDDNSLATAAERYFSANPQADSRTEEALHLYENALLRWFASLPGQPGAEDQKRIKRYKTLTTKLVDGGRI